MAGVLPRRPSVLLLGVLLVFGLLSGPARSDTTAVVMVLCPEDLPEGLPTCEEVVEALDAEIEEFSMYAVAGPSPKQTPPEVVAGPGVPFVIWATAQDEQLVLHAYEAANDVEVSKTLDLSTMDELPTARDLAILYTNLMGTSLYAELAALEGEEIISLAVPEEKEAVILERAAEGKGKADIPRKLKIWFPQFFMGWALVSYPDQDNLNNDRGDVYNGLMLSLRFPFRKGFWAGASIILPQTRYRHFFDDIPEESRPPDITMLRFNSDQIVISAEAGWYPLQKDRIALWIGAGPGITRTSTRLAYKYLHAKWGKIEDPTVRLTLGGAAGFQVIIAPRVRLETGLRIAWVGTLDGDDEHLFNWWTVEHVGDEVVVTEYGYMYYQHKNFQLSFWITMGFG